MTIFKAAATMLLALLSGGASAQSDTIPSGKVVTNARMIGVGATDILDTYLSQEKFRGTELRYISHTMREPEGRHWGRLIVHQGNLAFADNRSGDGGEIAGAYYFSYGVRRRFAFPVGNATLTVRAGAQADVTAGFIYNTRGSNNPAQARFDIGLSPSAGAAYDFTVGGKPLTVTYEASVPLLGVMFSPNYGQSYYEIFSEGNYDHNIVPTTIGSTPSFRQMLTLDFRLLHATWRVGYLGDYRQASVNSLKQHTYTHSLVVGVVKSFSVAKLPARK